MHHNEIITTEQSSSVNVDTTWPVSILAAESLRIFAVLRKSSATVMRCLHVAIVSATDRATAVDYEYLLTLVPPHREGRISVNTVLTSLLLLYWICLNLFTMRRAKPVPTALSHGTTVFSPPSVHVGSGRVQWAYTMCVLSVAWKCHLFN